jgi:hypothetical protein
MDPKDYEFHSSFSYDESPHMIGEGNVFHGIYLSFVHLIHLFYFILFVFDRTRI